MSPPHADLVAALRSPSRHLDLDGARQAAVAAIVTPSGELVFIRRAQHDRDPWSGHVSFPGGRREPHDPSLLHAAMRETLEELGIGLSDQELLGELDDVTTPAHLPSLVVRPFVFAVAREPVPTPNAEVASVHRVPLEDLLAGRGRGAMDWTWRGTPLVLPRVDFDGVRLWGLTLHIVDDLLHRIDGRGRGSDRPTR